MSSPAEDRIALRLPQSGTQTAATFVQWMVKVGDRVEAGDKLGSAETEKAVVDLEAPVSGRIAELLVQPQDEIETDTILGYIDLDRTGRVTVEPAVVVSPPASRTGEPPGSAKSELHTEKPDSIRPLSPALKRAAENLYWVSQHTARAATTIEVDFEAIASTRSTRARAFLDAHSVRLTYLPFVASAAIRALLKYPEVCGRLDVEAGTLAVPSHVHLGIAVARQAGLIVPVIRHAEQLGFAELCRRIHQAAEKVRTGSFASSEVQGSTFTISNPGVFGSYLSSPIMNQGETAILCIDAIEPRPVVVRGEIVARRRAFLTLAFDHRVIDGMLALTFLNDIKQHLETHEVAWLEETVPGADGDRREEPA